MKRLIACAVALLLLVSCAPFSRFERYEATWYDVFDTVTVLRGYAESRADFDRIANAAHRVLLEYHTLFDIYHDADVPNLKAVNDAAGGAPVAVDARLIDLLIFARDVDEMTGHRVNCTLGAVLSLWHDAREAALADPASAVLPDPAALTEAARHTGFALLEIDEQNGTVRLADPLARLDVGAIGKGFAAQRVAEALPDGYVLSLGGNIAAVGAKPDGEPFVIGIQNPDDPNALQHTVRAIDLSVVTSGDYQRQFTIGGVRYHHIIDPDTLRPAARFRAVTVLHPDSAMADALSTALFLLDREAGEALCAAHGAEALWIDTDGNEFMTEGFQTLIRD